MTEIKRDKEVQYIIDESQEISIGESPGWANNFFKAFPALKSRNYQLYFSGQLISLIGSWLQIVAQGWLVFELTHSAFWVGFVVTANSLPVLIFSLFGGVIVDRYKKKKIIFLTQSMFMLLALLLGFLTIANIINVYEITIIGFIFGVVNALDMPARQAYVIEMVGRDKIASAVALNSGTFNGARIIGPAIGSILVALFGVGISFILNGLSYIAVIIALKFIKVEEHLKEIHPHPLTAIKEGLKYAYKIKLIRILLINVGIISVFGWAFMAILPVIAQDVFNRGVSGLGYLYTSFGLGAVVATIIVSAFSNKILPKYFIFGGNIALIISLLIFSLSQNFVLALIAIFVVGFSLLVQVSTMNSTIQHTVRHHLRGRVMSIYSLMFIGMSTFGNFEVGILAEHLGARIAIILNVLFFFIFSYFFVYKTKSIWQESDRAID